MDNDEHTLTTALGNRVVHYKPQVPHFLNRATVLYGQSETGKSTTCKDILYILQHYLSWGLIVTPTDNGDFDGCFDRLFIKRDITLLEIKKIFERQTLAKDVYMKANDIKVLAMLFQKVSNRYDQQCINNMKTSADLIIDKLKSDKSVKPAEKIKVRKSIMKRLDKEMKEFYKITIQKHMTYFKTNFKKLTEDERHAIKYINFCPNILLIFEDCASKIKGWLSDKKYGSLIKDMFYNGRHYFMTQIYMIQEEKELDPLIRKNVFMSIFGNDVASIGYFNKTTTGITKAKTREVFDIIDRVYAPYEDSEINHQKLVYGRKLNPQFQYMVADIYDDDAIYIGGTPIREYCEKLRATEKKLNQNNSFYNNFKV